MTTPVPDPDPRLVETVRAGLDRVREQVERALDRAGRRGSHVTIVGVTKTVPVEVVRAAWAAGLRDVGENRVQEGRDKQAVLGDLPLRWHLVGHLQRNKVRYVVGSYALLHSLDRLSLAEELSRRASRLGVTIDCLVQVNVSGEASKSGVAPRDLIPLLYAVAPLEGIRIRGLMTIPPQVKDAEDARPYFRELRRLADLVEQEFGGSAAGSSAARVSMEHLSMGMSADFPVAVEEGATIIRVGQALFGPRSA